MIYPTSMTQTPTQKSSNVTVTLAEGIGLTHYPQLVLRAKASTLRLLAHFGILDPRRIAAGGISSRPTGSCRSRRGLSLNQNTHALILLHPLH